MLSGAQQSSATLEHRLRSQFEPEEPPLSPHPSPPHVEANVVHEDLSPIGRLSVDDPHVDSLAGGAGDVAGIPEERIRVFAATLSRPRCRSRGEPKRRRGIRAAAPQEFKALGVGREFKRRRLRRAVSLVPANRKVLLALGVGQRRPATDTHVYRETTRASPVQVHPLGQLLMAASSKSKRQAVASRRM